MNESAMSELLPSLAEIKSAQALVYSAVPPTPQYRWPLLCERLGTEVWMKHENHTPTGAFKARTAVVYVDELMRRAPDTRGLITATRGNHGQSVALAGQRFGLPVSIVVPFGNSQGKNAAMRAQGAQLIEYGADFQAAREHGLQLAAEHGLHNVPSFHRDILRGVATYWLELFTAHPDLDVAYVPIGQGSGACSAIAVRNALGLKTELIGVVSEHAPAYALSFTAGRCIEAAVSTRVADGMACRVPDPASLQIMLGNLARVVTVSDDEVLDAMAMVYHATHNVLEGAGAAAFAAAYKEKSRLHGKKVAVVACGGNVDAELFIEALARKV
jgi:threonine dehydratase